MQCKSVEVDCEEMGQYFGSSLLACSYGREELECFGEMRFGTVLWGIGSS